MINLKNVIIDEGLPVKRYIDSLDMDKTQKLIIKMQEIGNKCRRKGILALESYISSDDELYINEDYLSDKLNELWRIMLFNIIDAYEPDLVEQFGYNYIVSSFDNNCDIILATLIVNGILAVQDGMNTRVIYKLLQSFVGIGNIPNLKD